MLVDCFSDGRIGESLSALLLTTHFAIRGAFHVRNLSCATVNCANDDDGHNVRERTTMIVL